MPEQFFPRILRGPLCGPALIALASLSLIPQAGKTQVSVVHPASDTLEATSKPAIRGILSVFGSFEVVAMPAAHGQKDIDDFILSLIRDPSFPTIVNDIVVECGNLRYQSNLDRYIAGENIPFAEVQHVWRDTTVQQMCGASGFYEQLFPLVRSINRRLPATSRLRIVAADPPIDWAKIRSYDDLTPFFDRDGSIASVMEGEVLSKHRKALMLFGVFHLLHGGGPGQGDAVTRYERRYPGSTFVISDLGYYGTGNQSPSNVKALGEAWPTLIKTKNNRLGSLGLDSFLLSPLTTDEDCNVREAFGGKPSETVSDQIDAFLYLGPPELLLAEPLPADIALDRTYRTEWLHRMKLVGMPGPSTLEELDGRVVESAADPMLAAPPKESISQEIRSRIREGCLNRKHSTANPENER